MCRKLGYPKYCYIVGAKAVFELYCIEKDQMDGRKPEKNNTQNRSNWRMNEFYSHLMRIHSPYFNFIW